MKCFTCLLEIPLHKSAAVDVDLEKDFHEQFFFQCNSLFTYLPGKFISVSILVIDEPCFFASKYFFTKYLFIGITSGCSEYS